MKYRKDETSQLENFITDDDIILTDSTDTLKQRLEWQDKSIRKLEANVKWMYRYGALGTGGGGGGDDTTGKVTVLFYKDGDSMILPETQMIYSEKGKRKFKVVVRNGGSDTFNITYSFGTRHGSIRVNADNDFTAEFLIDYYDNHDLIVMVENISTGEYYTYNNKNQLVFPVVVNAYKFTANYVQGSDYTTTSQLNAFTPSNNSIFMDTAGVRGLMLAVNYTVSVPVVNCTITYNDWENRTVTVLSNGTINKSGSEENYAPANMFKQGNGTVYLPLSDDIIAYLANPQNAGYKHTHISVYLTSNVSQEMVEVATFDLRDTLIKSGLFMSVTTKDGMLSSTVEQAQQTTIENMMSLGNVKYTVTAYYNTPDSFRQYPLTVQMFDAETEEPIGSVNRFTLNDQVATDINVPVNRTGVVMVRFVLSFGDEHYTVNYYINVREFNSELKWYYSDPNDDYSFYFRKDLSDGSHNVIDPNGNPISTENNIRMTANDTPKTYTFDSGVPINSVNGYDLMQCLGIQYSVVNDYENPICSFNVKGSTATNKGIGTIFIYQNKVCLTTQVSTVNMVTGAVNVGAASEKDIFIHLETDYDPTVYDNFGLFTLYERLDAVVANKNYKGIYCYIDGVLECAFPNWEVNNYIYDSVTFYPANYAVNLVEESWFVHNADNLESSITRTWMNDIDIANYRNKYLEQIIVKGDVFATDEVSRERYKAYIESVSEHFNYDNENFIVIDDDFTEKTISGTTINVNTHIENVARYVDMPVMVLQFNDTSGNTIGMSEFSGFGVDNFKGWMSKSYQDENSEGADLKQTVNVLYSADKNDGLKPIMGIDSTNLAPFSVSLQGSSTKSFRAKNFELYAPQAETGRVCVYSPNVSKDKNNKTSFLPEESFTLKADVVDSAHTNNTAMGKFIDDNTTQFAAFNRIAVDSNGITYDYADRLKNCLRGFPILLFLNTNYYNADKTEMLHKFYYLGIYNFNLGRKSYFNLGIKDMGVVNEAIKNSDNEGFCLYEIDEEGMLKDVRGAEIQSNSPYFDFSQWTDYELLFNDPMRSMWGDFIDGLTATNSSLFSTLQSFMERIGLGGGFVFESIGKSLSEDASKKYGYQDEYFKYNCVPNYKHQVSMKVESGMQPTFTFSENALPPATLENLRDLVLGYTDEGGTFHTPYVNFISLAEYYTTCMAFGLLDSVQKNLNVRSWDGGQTYYITFYDMDTCLGINNAGTYTNYYAFSDYWVTNWTETSAGVGQLSQASIYRDYRPNATGEDAKSFFDKPSSYLFAVAKYAYCVLNAFGVDRLENILQYDPSNIWGRWRSKHTDGSGTLGCLESAKSFMKNYFADHLSAVPSEMFNFNYRYKYFVKNSANNGFDSGNYIKFHGRRLAYTEHWLDGRLHLLDAYFNINGFPDVMYIDRNNVTFYAPATNALFQPSTNPDVVILNDAFNPERSNQYVVSGSTTFVGTPHAPMIIAYPNSVERYVFPDDEKPCVFSITPNSTQTIVYYGSRMITGMKNITPIINTDSTFTVNSDYITDIESQPSLSEINTCGNWNIVAPSLKRLVLKSPHYTGNIVFPNPSDESYENLDEIDISTSGINLTLNKVPIKKIYATGMTGTSNIHLTECTKLEDLRLSGKFGTLTLSSWSDDCRLPYSGTMECDTINISNDLERFPQCSLTVSNNNKITELNASDFTEIHISNCPNLSRINISNVGNIEVLDINMPNMKSVSLNGNNSSVLDLSQYRNLEEISMRNSEYTEIVMPAECDIKIKEGGFYGCTNLVRFTCPNTTKLFITGKETFYDCRKFTLADSEGSLLPVYVDPETTSLANTFYCKTSGSITDSVASDFLTLRCTQYYVGNVTDIDSMFRNQTNIDVSFAEENAKRKEGDAFLPLGGFVNCANCTNIFDGCKLKLFNRYMFKGYASNLTEYAFTPIGNFTYTTTDMFYELIGKLTSIDFGASNSLYVMPSDSTNGNGRTPLIPVVVNDFFTNNCTNKINKIKNFSLSGSFVTVNNIRWTDSVIYYNFNGLFDHGNTGERIWTADNITLENFMFDTYNIHSFSGNVDGMFTVMPVVEIKNSFNNFVADAENVLENYLDLYGMFDWDAMRSTSVRLWSTDLNTDSTNMTSSIGGLDCKKYITYEHFNEVWDKIAASTKLVALSKLFSNCYIINPNITDTNIPVFNLCSSGNTAVNTTLKNVPHLFFNLRLVASANDIVMDKDYPLDIRNGFLRNFTGIIGYDSTFAGLYLKHALPFDFFGRRKRIEINNGDATLYGNADGTNPVKTLVRYTYPDENILTLRNAFSNITFASVADATWRPEAEYNGDLGRNCAICAGGDVVYKYYKVSGGSAQEVVIEQPIEITDADNIPTSTASVPTYTPNVAGTPAKDYDNPYHLSEGVKVSNHNPNGYVVPPDIFRGVGANGIIDGAFSFSNTYKADEFRATGVIPSGLMRGTNSSYMATKPFNNVFFGLYVTPILAHTEVVGGKTHRYYQFVPNNFTDLRYITQGFNFALLIPRNDNEVTEHYYMFSSNSLVKNLVYVERSLPVDVNGCLGDTGSHDDVHECWKYDNGIHWNIMFTKTENGGNLSIVDGIDHQNVFTSFRYNNLVNYHIAKVLNGHVIKNGLSWSGNLLTDAGSYKMFYEVSTVKYIGLSRKCLLPIVSNNQGMFPNSANSTNGWEYHINTASRVNNITITQDELNAYWKNYVWE